MDDKNLPENENKDFIGDNEDFIFQYSDIKPHSERWFITHLWSTILLYMVCHILNFY